MICLKKYQARDTITVKLHFLKKTWATKVNGKKMIDSQCLLGIIIHEHWARSGFWLSTITGSGRLAQCAIFFQIIRVSYFTGWIIWITKKKKKNG